MFRYWSRYRWARHSMRYQTVPVPCWVLERAPGSEQELERVREPETEPEPEMSPC